MLLQELNSNINYLTISIDNSNQIIKRIKKELDIYNFIIVFIYINYLHPDCLMGFPI